MPLCNCVHEYRVMLRLCIAFDWQVQDLQAQMQSLQAQMQGFHESLQAQMQLFQSQLMAAIQSLQPPQPEAQ